MQLSWDEKGQAKLVFGVKYNIDGASSIKVINEKSFKFQFDHLCYIFIGQSEQWWTDWSILYLSISCRYQMFIVDPIGSKESNDGWT